MTADIQALREFDYDSDRVPTDLEEAIYRALDRLETAEAALLRVREQHQYEVIGVHEGYGEEIWCPTCKHHWPCPTIRALESETK